MTAPAGPKSSDILNWLLAALAFWAATQLSFSVQLSRPAWWSAIWCLAAIATLASYAGSRNLRMGLLLIGFATVGMLHIANLIPPSSAPAYGAWRAGRPYDSRAEIEVLDQLRRDGIPVHPAFGPRAILESRPSGLVSDGRPLLPLASVSNHAILGTAESGQYPVYQSDEHGFNNPPGLWIRHPQIVVIGDSMVQGMVVPSDQTLPSHFRKYFPKTLALGLGGDGPLLDLANLKEYATELRPPIVLWCFYWNDVDDIASELMYPALVPYLQPDYRQHLITRQKEIDRALEDLEAEVSTQARAAVWPPWAVAMGIPRARLPVWVQDIIAGTAHTKTAAVIRLDTIYEFVLGFARRAGTPRVAPGASPDRFEEIRRVLAQARDLVGSWGGKMYVVLLPHTGSIRNPQWWLTDANHQRVQGIVKDLRIPLIDVSPEYSKHPDLPSLYFYPYSHPNGAGNREIARIIADALKSVGVVAEAETTP